MLRNKTMLEAINISQLNQCLPEMLDQVAHGQSIALEKNHQIVAMLTPPPKKTHMKIQALNQFFIGLPQLDEDTTTFANDLETIRQQIPAETSSWD